MSVHMTFALHCPAGGWKAAFALVTLCAGVSLSAAAQRDRITTFDVPGAGTASGQGTFAWGINALGVITGWYTDANNVSHGFLRSPQGKLTTFDPPGAANLAGGGTNVIGLNLEGAAVGFYADENFAIHAFLRSPNGKFTTFVSPAECTTSVNDGCHGTGAWDINVFGVIAGAYEDTSGNFVAHAFIRFPDGKFTLFAVPGSSMQAGQGTLPANFSGSGLNQSGAITGLYYDANNVFHGYLRSPNGTFTDFEAPGADTTDAFYGTTPTSLSDFGSITGYYIDANGVSHGFVRSSDGKFANFEAPGADTTPGDFNGTYPENINLFGTVVGNYIDSSNTNHGFVRNLDGGLTTFDVPSAGVGNFLGTVPVSNNLEGAITGSYYDANNLAHGFVRKP